MDSFMHPAKAEATVVEEDLPLAPSFLDHGNKSRFCLGSPIWLGNGFSIPLTVIVEACAADPAPISDPNLAYCSGNKLTTLDSMDSLLHQPLRVPIQSL
ncbi:hypothetical protein RHMOL_Rhmol07G0301000 [Rhododendron molle]|uniref:Uncharacterized protein n=1 Tax=Rhododendron molle TaxID=49168 RepID=A0ACC0N699_RHOML|nr:hypothetical protein RHMOL_Rhmol07G0301000 [Rhododendron molle]